MITASILATLLAVVMPPAGAAAGAAAPVSAHAADEKITLNLRDADLKNLLEKLATLMDVTPIIASGIGGTVTMSVSAPVSEILRSLERDFQITIGIADGRMIVSKAASLPPALADDAVDANYLSDSRLARRAAAATPKRFEGAVELTTSTGEIRIYSLETDGGIAIPGCPPGLAIFPLEGDRVDGLPGLVLKTEGALPRPHLPGIVLKSDLPRVLSPTLEDIASVDVPGCSGPLSVRLVASRAGAIAPAPLSSVGQFIVQPRVIEVGPQEETVLLSPQIHVPGGHSAAITSKEDRSSSRGVSLFQTIETSLVVVEASEKDATVAISSSIVRDIEARSGGPPVTIRIARARESARLAFGKAHRIVLSPTFGRGDSALVLDLVIERLPGKN